MIDWTLHTIGTSRDPERAYQRRAIALLNEALHARIAYDTALQSAIKTYGDRHTPDKIDGVVSDCRVCLAHGIQHTAEEQLNHQTGSAISGIYADHFPSQVKDELRHRLHCVTRAMDSANAVWGQTGRRNTTFWALCKLSRQLPDGRVSYY